MRVIIHDLGDNYNKLLVGKNDTLISANGKYASCQGCFNCWTSHPAECFIKDSLKDVSRIIGQADEMIVISENYYGSYSPYVKNILDRSIGASTPLSTYRDKQMHHVLRYGKHKKLKVFVYGDITSDETETFKLLTERNAINFGYENFDLVYLDDISNLENVIL